MRQSRFIEVQIIGMIKVLKRKNGIPVIEELLSSFEFEKIVTKVSINLH